MDAPQQGHGDEDLASANRGRSVTVRYWALTALSWEAIWPTLIPAVCVILAFLSVTWLGVWNVAPAWLRYGALALFAAAFVWSLRPFLSLRWPSEHDITRRIEQESALEHRPITAQTDAMAMGHDDPFARALWQTHVKRMAERLDNLRAGEARPRANRADPWAVRAMLALIAFAAFGYSFGGAGGRIADAFAPRIASAPELTRLDVWINPPRYTRKPPVYLSPGGLAAGSGPSTSGYTAGEETATQTVRVPQGSELVLRHVGSGEVALKIADEEETLTISAAAAETPEDPGKPIVAADNGETRFTHTLERSGTIIFLRNGREVAQWPVEVIADLAPTIKMTEIPSAALSGSLQLAYAVEDDYGVVKATGEVRSNLQSDPNARPLVGAPELILPLPRQRAKTGTAKVNRDLTQHPWAGSEVTISLLAEDDAGQTGRSEPHTMMLPGRRFSDPLALALLEQRRVLASDANKAGRVAQMLDAVSFAPEEFIANKAVYVGLRMVYRQILDARDDDRLRDALDEMWEIALAIEFGDLSEAEQALREAQEKLSEALERGAEDEEIAKLTEELRKAMEELLQQLAREAQQNPLAQNPYLQNDNLRTLRQSDLNRMLDQIEDLARSGSRDAARQMLSELQRMMDNLRAGRHQQQRQNEANQMNQMLDKMSELMRRQQELMDETFQMNQNRPPIRPNQQQRQQQRNQQQQGEQQQGQRGEQQPGEGDQPMTPEEFAEALKQLQEQQEQLTQELSELGKQLEGMGIDPSEGLGEAEREMGEAGKNLGQGEPGNAAGDQGQALEALRRGAQSVMQQMAGEQGQGGQQPGEGMAQGGPDRNRTDPLGRQSGSDGLETGDDTKVPGEIDAQRAREIMEAIRKRLSQPYSAPIERNYLERLLEDR